MAQIGRRMTPKPANQVHIMIVIYFGETIDFREPYVKFFMPIVKAK